MTELEQEKKNKRVAMISTTGITAFVLLLMFLIIAWRAPDPPLPEFGIELNFGTDDAGSGAIQPTVPAGEPESVPEEVIEETSEESEPEPSEEISEVEEAAPEETQPAQEQIVSKVESPVAVKEEPKKQVTPVEKPSEKPEEKKPATKTEPVKEPPKPTPKAVYTPNAEKNDAATNKQGEAGSQGDDVNKAGDKGSPEGKVDAKALYGKAGGGAGGSSLDLDGWEWDSRPAPSIPDNELGGIVKFEIKVDDRGEILSIRTLERSVSPDTEQICRKAVEKLTFTKTGANVPQISTGTITFVVRSR